MLHTNVVENKGGFRCLELAELESVSGGFTIIVGRPRPVTEGIDGIPFEAILASSLDHGGAGSPFNEVTRGSPTGPSSATGDLEGRMSLLDEAMSDSEAEDEELFSLILTILSAGTVLSLLALGARAVLLELVDLENRSAFNNWLDDQFEHFSDFLIEDPNTNSYDGFRDYLMSPFSGPEQPYR
ncbi:MAG: hypothetical protein ABJN35_14840 [Erythrobacter sp.]